LLLLAVRSCFYSRAVLASAREDDEREGVIDREGGKSFVNEVQQGETRGASETDEREADDESMKASSGRKSEGGSVERSEERLDGVEMLTSA